MKYVKEMMFVLIIGLIVFANIDRSSITGMNVVEQKIHNLGIVDSNGKNLDYAVHLINTGKFTSQAGKDFEIIPSNHTIKKIDVYGAQVEDKLINIDEFNSKKFIQSYAIDPTGLKFNDAIVTVVAKGTKLYKCKDWNFSTQQCYGNWTLFKDGLVPGQEYTFTLTADDPGFGEIIEITQAWHLDSNKNILNEITDLVKYQDLNWSGNISTGEFIRVKFQENLTKENDITIYAKGDENSSIKVWEENNLVATFYNINDDGYSKILLENLIGEKDTFDLEIFGKVNFDQIIDPTVSAHYTGFETGNDGWNNPGPDSKRISSGVVSSRCDDSGVCTGTGNYLWKIQDDSSKSYTSQKFDFSTYDYVNLSFWMYESGWEPGKYVKILCDGTEVWRQTDGDFTEDQWLFKQIQITPSDCTFDNSVEIKFTGRPGLKDNSDNWYLDGINITGFYYDTVLPGSVTNLQNVSNGVDHIDWTWLNPSDSDFDYSLVYLDGVNVINTSNTYYNGTGFTCETEYNLTVLTKDVNGNINTTFVTNLANTTKCPDLTQPIVTLNNPVDNYVNDSTSIVPIIFNCSATDNENLKNISLYLTDSTNNSFSLNNTCGVSGLSGSCEWIKNLSVGNYTWNCLAYDVANNSAFGINRSVKINYTDKDAPVWSNVNEPIDPSTYNLGNLYNFNITWVDNVEVDSVLFEFEGINYSVLNLGNVYSFDIENLSAGTYYYKWFANDTFGNVNVTNQFNFTVNQAPTIITLVADSYNVNYGTYTNISCNANNDEVVVLLLKNGSVVSNPDYQILGAGVYNYTCVSGSSQNYTSAVENITIVVNKSLSSVNLLLDSIDGNITVPIYSIVNESGYLITGENGLELLEEGSSVLSGNSPLEKLTQYNTPGEFNVTLVGLESENYTSSYETYFVKVIDNVAPVVNLISPANGFSTNVGSQNFVFNYTDNYFTSANCSLYVDDVEVSNNNSVLNNTNTQFNYVLSEGSFDWYVNCTDGSGNVNQSEIRTIVLDLSSPVYSNINEPNDPSNFSLTTYNFNVTWSDLSLDSISIEWEGINYTVLNSGNVYSFDIENLSVGTYYYKWFANDTFGNTNVTNMLSFTVNQAPTILTINMNPASSVTYGTTTNVNCTANNDEVSVSLLRNGAIVSNPDINLFAGGQYNYSCVAIGGTNYSNTVLNQSLVINKIISSIDLLVDGSDNNIFVEVGDYVNETAIMLTGNNFVEIYEEGSFVINGSSPLNKSTQYNTVGVFTATGKAIENENYTASQDTHQIYVIDNTIPNITLISPPNNLTVNTSYVLFEFNATDNYYPTLSCELFFDGISYGINNSVINGAISSFNVSVPMSNFYWEINCTDGNSNKASSENRHLFTDSIPPELFNITPVGIIYNNGLEENVTINFTASEYPINITFELFNDSTLANTQQKHLNNKSLLPIVFTIIDSLADGNYKLNITAFDRVGLNKEYYVLEIIVNSTDLIPPIIHEIIVEPDTHMQIMGKYINVSVNSSDNILVDTEKILQNYPVVGGEADLPISFNFSTTGLYKYNITVNDTSNNTAGEKVNILIGHNLTSYQFNLVNESLNGINGSVGLYYNNTFIFGREFEGSHVDSILTDYLYDFKYQAENGLASITSKDINVTIDNNKTLLYQEVSTPGFISSIGIESDFNSSNMSVLIYNYTSLSYTNEDYLEVYKCEDWNETISSCYGTWNKISAVQDKISNIFTIETNTFSGYAIKQATIPSTSNSGGGSSGGSGRGSGGSGSYILPKENETKEVIQVEENTIQNYSFKIIKQEFNVQDKEFVIKGIINNTGKDVLRNVYVNDKLIGDIGINEFVETEFVLKNNVCEDGLKNVEFSVVVNASEVREYNYEFNLTIPEYAIIVEDQYNDLDVMKMCIIYQGNMPVEFEVSYNDEFVDYISSYETEGIVFLKREYQLMNVESGNLSISAYKDGKLFSNEYTTGKIEKEIKINKTTNLVGNGHIGKYNLEIYDFNKQMVKFVLVKDITLKLYETAKIDLDKDGINDLRIKYAGLLDGEPKFEIEIINPLKMKLLNSIDGEYSKNLKEVKITEYASNIQFIPVLEIIGLIIVIMLVAFNFRNLEKFF